MNFELIVVEEITSVGEADEIIAAIEAVPSTSELYKLYKAVATRANQLAKANGWTKTKDMYLV